MDEPRRKVRNTASHSLGILVIDQNSREVVSNLISKHALLPISVVRRFGTVDSNQMTFELTLVENEEVADIARDKENWRELGTAVLSLPHRLPAGSPIDITFTVDEQGLLTVSWTTGDSDPMQAVIETK